MQYEDLKDAEAVRNSYLKDFVNQYPYYDYYFQKNSCMIMPSLSPSSS